MEQAAATGWLLHDAMCRVRVTLDEAHAVSAHAADLHMAIALAALRRSLRAEHPSLEPMRAPIWTTLGQRMSRPASGAIAGQGTPGNARDPAWPHRQPSALVRLEPRRLASPPPTPASLRVPDGVSFPDRQFGRKSSQSFGHASHRFRRDLALLARTAFSSSVRSRRRATSSAEGAATPFDELLMPIIWRLWARFPASRLGVRSGHTYRFEPGRLHGVALGADGSVLAAKRLRRRDNEAACQIRWPPSTVNFRLS